MEAADMFDVFHVFYEEDITPMWEQHIDVKDQVRKALYSMLYGREYKFASTKATGPDGIEMGPTDENGFPAAAPGASNETKPYIPPSSPADLERVLGVPMS